MSQANRPDRDFVRQVVEEEAAASGLALDQVLNSSSVASVAARRRALLRIKRTTGCSTFGLATVFGCDHGAVLDALREPPPHSQAKAPPGFRKVGASSREVSAWLTCFAEIERIQHEGFAR